MKLATAAKSCRKLTDLWGPKKPVDGLTNVVTPCSVRVENISTQKKISLIAVNPGVAKKSSPGKQKTPGLGLSPKSKSIQKKVASKAGLNLSPTKRKLGLGLQETKCDDILIIFEDNNKLKKAKENFKENNGSKLKSSPFQKKTCLKEVNRASTPDLEIVVPEVIKGGNTFKNVSKTKELRKPTPRSIFDTVGLPSLKSPPVEVTVSPPIIEEPAENFKDLPKPTPVECPIPQEIFADAIMIYEFLDTFESILDTKRYMGRQTSMELVTEILYDSSLTGPLGKLLEMLLDAAYVNGNKVAKYKESQLPSIIQWEKVRKIPCDPYILSELVRLHILLSHKPISKKSLVKKQEKDPIVLLGRKSAFELSPDERVIVIEELMQCLLRLPAYSQLAWDMRCDLKGVKRNLKTIKKLKGHKNQDAVLDTLVQMQIIKEAFPVELEPSSDPDGQAEETSDNTECSTQPKILSSLEVKPGEALTSTSLDVKPGEILTPSPVTSLKVKPGEVLTPTSLKVNPGEVLTPTSAKSEVEQACLRKEMIKKEGLQNVLDKFEASLKKQFKKFVAPIYLGCDREYRRYWVFQSMPFLFVENISDSKRDLLVEDKVSAAVTCQDPVDNGKDVKISTSLPEEQKVTTLMAGDATETVPKWAFYSQKESIDQLLESFSSKVFPESGLKEKMAHERERLIQILEKCPTTDPWKSVFESKVVGRRSRRLISAPATAEDAHEALEQCLIEALVENEEKLRVGWLGGVKENVEDWQNALEGRHYEKFSADNAEDSRPRGVAAYANALLNLKQSVRSSYFRLCFDREPSDTVTFNARSLMSQWEAYVEQATSLSQLFLCLTLFERSVHWEASLSEAICRICQSKKAEGMLLCDKCDRGYHMTCLDPQIEEVPDGNWFCHLCEKKMFRDAETSDDCQHSAEEKLMMSCLSCYAVIEFCMKCNDGTLPVSVLCLSCGNRTVTRKAKILRVQPKKSKTRRGKESQNRSSERIRKIALCTMSSSLRDERPKASRKSPSTRMSLRNAEKVRHESEKTPTRLTRKRWRSQKAQSDSEEEEEVIKRRRSSRRIRADQEIQELLDEPNSGSCTDSQDCVLDVKVCEEIMSKLVVHEDSASFLFRVNASQDRKYYSVIKTPMDLVTVRSNLRGMVYHSNSELIKDVQLIFDNSKAYYKNPRNAIYKSAHRLESFFYKLLDKYELISKKKK